MYIMLLKAFTGTVLQPVHLLELQVSLGELVICEINMRQRKFLEYEYDALLRYTHYLHLELKFDFFR